MLDSGTTQSFDSNKKVYLKQDYDDDDDCNVDEDQTNDNKGQRLTYLERYKFMGKIRKDHLFKK